MTATDGRGGVRRVSLGPSAFLVLGYAARLGMVIISDWTSFSRLHPNQITVCMGQLHEQAYLTFCQSILDEPPAMDPRLASIYAEEAVPVGAEA